MHNFCNLSCALAALFMASSAPALGQSMLDPTRSQDSVTLKVAELDAVGPHVTDQRGRAVYMFTVDKPGKSECKGPCEKDWMPVMTRGDASAGEGAEKDKVGTISSGDRDRQVTYAGHPLYFFVQDGGKQGATTGQAVASYSGFWYLLTPKGEPIKAKRSGEFPEPEKLEPRN